METQLGLIIGPSNKTAIDALRNPAIKCLWLFGPSDVGKTYLANLLSPGAVILDPVNPAEDLVTMLDKHWAADQRVIMIAHDRPREVIANPRQLTRIARGAICPIEPWTEAMRAEYFAQLTPGADTHGRAALLECVSGGPRTLLGLATAWRVSRFSMEPEALAPIVASYGAIRLAAAQRLGIEDVLEVVCEYYNTKISDVLSQRRTKNLAFPRHLVCYLAKEMTNLTLVEIGRFVGGRDHSTVLHAVNKIRSKLLADSALSAEVTRIRHKIEMGNL